MQNNLRDGGAAQCFPVTVKVAALHCRGSAKPERWRARAGRPVLTARTVSNAGSVSGDREEHDFAAVLQQLHRQRKKRAVGRPSKNRP